MIRIGSAGAAFAVLLAFAIPARATEPDGLTAEEAMAQAHATYGAVRRSSCGGDPGEIVVCARRERDQQVPSTAESDPASRAARHALDNGVPRAPQLDRGSCKGQGGCFVGGWAPPPVFMVDLKAIPEAPAGSDADRMAKGVLSHR